jgi:hypothetical protein
MHGVGFKVNGIFCNLAKIEELGKGQKDNL